MTPTATTTTTITATTTTTLTTTRWLVVVVGTPKKKEGAIQSIVDIYVKRERDQKKEAMDPKQSHAQSIQIHSDRIQNHVR